MNSTVVEYSEIFPNSDYIVDFNPSTLGEYSMIYISIFIHKFIKKYIFLEFFVK
jgi:hypothetical protein